MKVYLSIIIFIFSFQSWTKADDIKDFEIEGMSIGDSLLNYYTKNEIINSELPYFSQKRKYYVIGLFDNNWKFDQIEIYLKQKDSKYKIRALVGMIDIDNLEECLLKRQNIDSQVEDLFVNATKSTGSKPNESDTTGNSIQYITQYLFDKDNHIRIECMQWSQKMKTEKGFFNTLNLVVMSDEISKWILSGYK